MKEKGELPADLDLPRWVRGDLEKKHDKALAKQKELWGEYEIEFEDAQDRYRDQVGKEVRRRQAQGDREGAAYLAREKEAVAEKAYFLAILRGEFPDVPDGQQKARDDDDQE